MKHEPNDQEALDLESVLGDEKLTRVRRAYHELEAFQLSDQHEAVKKKLKESLAHPDTDSETPADN